MLLLLLALTALLFALYILYSGLRGTTNVGGLFWFTGFYLAFIHIAFLWNFIKEGSPEFGPASTGLTVTTTSLLAVTIAGMASAGRPISAAQLQSTRLASHPRRLFGLAIVVLVPAWLYFALLGSVPLIAGFQAIISRGSSGLGALQEARLARDPYVNDGAAYIPLQGLLELFRNVGTPVLFAAALQYYLERRRAVYLLLMAICLVTVLAAGQRWPLQYLILCTLISVLLGVRRRSSRVWRFAIIGAILGAGLTLLQGRGTTAGEGGPSFLGGLTAVIDRMVMGYANLPIQSYYMDLPSLQNQGGATYVQSLMAFLPGQSVTYAVTFYNIVLGIADGGYTASPDFGTELYINFGLIGVVAGSASWGVLISWSDRYVLPRVQSVEGLAIASGWILCLAAASTEGAAASVLRFIILTPFLIGGANIIGRFLGAPPIRSLASPSGTARVDPLHPSADSPMNT